MDKETFLQAHGERLGDFTKMSQAVGRRPDYVQGGGGNTSVKLGGGLMAIKASGYLLSDIRPDAAYAVLESGSIRAFYENREPGDLEDVEGEGAAFVKAHTLAVEGLPQLRPSVEAGFHSLLDDYVVHSHSVYANLAACTEGGEAVLAEALAGAPYAWAFVPYTDPGARLTFRIRDALHASPRPAVILLQNHGLIVHRESAAAALALHEVVNCSIANFYDVCMADYPAIALARRPDGLLESATPFLRARLAGYGAEFLLTRPLCPDQMVYLTGTLVPGDGLPEAGQCAIAGEGGLVYNMPEAKARVIEETVCAAVYIMEHVKARGYGLSTMEEAAQRFIANWESETYRKSLLGK